MNITRIFARQRITKYHERTYWREAALLSVLAIMFIVGVLTGGYL